MGTAPAHLAWVLSKPVWTLLSWVPDWHWGLARRGDWTDILVRMAQGLREWRERSG